jgi:hypothetical protein
VVAVLAVKLTLINLNTENSMKNLMQHLLILFLMVGGNTSSLASDVRFDFILSSPVGSWQLREQVDTDHKGRQTALLMRTSMIAKENRNGKPHYWIEVGMDSFKISKKGKRKANGKRIVMKSLVPESTLIGDPANVLTNLRAFSVETIVQNGNSKPMRMNNAGGFMDGAMKMMNAEIKYDFQSQGNESVTVKAGQIDTHKIRGTGSVDMKLLFKKLHIDSDSTMWISNEVPFGTVKMLGTAVTNGKTSEQVGELLEYSSSGAVSEITQEPEDMPAMPKFGELFNG